MSDRPAPPKRSRVLVIVAGGVGVLSIGLAAAGIAVGWQVSAVPEPPDTPELSEVRLDVLAPLPRSPALAAAMARALGPLEHEAYADASEALHEERWLEGAEDRRAQLRDIDEAGRALAQALHEPGCLGGAALPVLARARAHVVSLVARLGSGDGDAATRDLARLLSGVAAMRGRCAHAMVGALVLVILSDDIHRVAAYALVAPDVEPDALEALGAAIAATEDFTSDLTGATSREWSELVGQVGPLPAASPIGRAHRRLRWLAELPPGAPDLTRMTPEERYVETLTRDHWRVAVDLRLGGEGLNGWLTAAGVITALRPRLRTYHETRCRWMHRRARWTRGLAARGRVFPTGDHPAPLDPFTGAPPDLDVHEEAACSPSARSVSAPLPDLPPPP